MKIHRSLVVLVTLASALECAAIILAVAMDRVEWLPLALFMHLLAAYLSSRAASVRRDDLSSTERDAVLWVAALVPMFGPSLAWSMPVPPPPPDQDEDDDADEVINAHDMFERYEEHVTPHNPDYERTLFTGDYARDIARELDAESYVEVLRHGTTDQKRNALRRLATLGDPKHFDQIRGCLLDPSHETRLYAYSELEKASQVFEEEIADLSKKLAKRPKHKASLLRLATVQYRYAASGIHDAAMAAFYFKTVTRYARKSIEAGTQGPEPVWLVARSLARLGQPNEALAEIAALPADEQEHPESCLVRASIRFQDRDFEAARDEAERIVAAGGSLPGWLMALRSEEEIEA